MSRYLVCILLNLCFIVSIHATPKGIYITQHTLESTKRIKHLIRESKAVGINTFVIDLYKKRKQYDRNIKLVLNNDIKYVVRIVVFPGGGNHKQVTSQAIRDKKLRLIKHAEKLGAAEIQLDYIRYNVKTPSSPENAKHIKKVIQWFEKQTKLPIQIAVFGVSAHQPSKSIGQNLPLFAKHVDVIAPMLYPSHYEPKQVHSYQPYATVKGSLDALVKQFNGHVPTQVITYIETSNYRRKMDYQTRYDYIKAQIQAVQDADLGGWYAWSANNHYRTLFQVLKQN